MRIMSVQERKIEKIGRGREGNDEDINNWISKKVNTKSRSWPFYIYSGGT